MKIAYVASTAASAELALVPDHVIEVCMSGPNPLADARSYAQDHTRAEDVTTYVYRVTVDAMHKFMIRKEVVGTGHSF